MQLEIERKKDFISRMESNLKATAPKREEHTHDDRRRHDQRQRIEELALKRVKHQIKAIIEDTRDNPMAIVKKQQLQGEMKPVAPVINSVEVRIVIDLCYHGHS